MKEILVNSLIFNFFKLIVLARWEIENGSNERIFPVIHKSQISSLAISSNGVLISTGWDDTIAFTEFVLTKLGKIILIFCLKNII